MKAGRSLHANEAAAKLFQLVGLWKNCKEKKHGIIAAVKSTQPRQFV